MKPTREARVTHQPSGFQFLTRPRPGCLRLPWAHQCPSPPIPPPSLGGSSGIGAASSACGRGARHRARPSLALLAPVASLLAAPPSPATACPSGPGAWSAPLARASFHSRFHAFGSSSLSAPSRVGGSRPVFVRQPRARRRWAFCRPGGQRSPGPRGGPLRGFAAHPQHAPSAQPACSRHVHAGRPLTSTSAEGLKHPQREGPWRS